MLHVICVAYCRPIELGILIGSFLTQTNQNWMLHIWHDGEAPQSVRDVISLPQHRNSKIEFIETPTRNGHYGHPNRRLALKQLSLNHRDFVLLTNDDNYYVPRFVDMFLKECRHSDVGFVYCDTVHSYYDYNVLPSEVRENHIDMGSFVVRVDVAKRIGFNHIHLSADGTYATECANYCRVRRLRLVHITKPLFIHN